MNLDEAGIAGRQDGGAALVADLLVGALDHAVAFAGLGRPDLAARSQREPLLARRFRLELGHFAILLNTTISRPGSPEEARRLTKWWPYIGLDPILQRSRGLPRPLSGRQHH